MDLLTRSRLTLLIGIAVIILMSLSRGDAYAQTYPTAPVQIIVPFSAGGDADQSARNLAAHAQGTLGEPLVVINRGGGNGIIGSQFVRNAKPDGYTLLLARIGSQVLLPALQPKTTSYSWNDFTFIGLLDLNPVICAVHPDSKYKSFNDLVKTLRERPGELSYSHPGVATVPNLTPQLLFKTLGLKLDAAINVPYKGGGDATLAVLSREVDFVCGNLSSMMGNLKGGTLRPLLTTTQERLDKFPDVMTAREAGFPQLEAMLGWSALYGPPGLDKAVVERWAAVLKGVALDPKWIAGTGNFGGIPKVMSPDETQRFVKEGFEVFQEIVKQANLQLE